MQSRTFSNVTPRQITAAQSALVKLGASVEATSASAFTISGMGILADANYESDRQSLTVQIFHKPIMIPDSLIFGKVQSMLDAVQSLLDAGHSEN